MSQSTLYTRTDKAIQQALITLLREKPFEKITVQDILDETPVTRATFYNHYHDKYEIVEKMQEEFLNAQKDMKKELLANIPSDFPALIQKSFSRNRDIMEALLKVHTERVDLRQALANELEQQYLLNADSPSKKAEAQVYAQALTAFQLSYLNEEKADFSSAYVNRVFISVMLKLLGLSEDKDVWEFLYKKMLSKS